MYFRILFINYLKNFLVIFFSLVLFFIFMDFMINKAKLPDSANLQILYMFYTGANASLLIYPLALLLSVLVTIISLVKKNEMIAFLSVGYSLKKMLLPIVSVAFFITSIFVFIQSISNTSFNDNAMSILKKNYFSNANTNLFFKFNNNVIFIKKLDVLNKTAYGMKIFLLSGTSLVRVYDIKQAKFINDSWRAKNIHVYDIQNTKISQNTTNLNLLKGFKPYILNKLESKQSMTLKIAFQALYLLKRENININFIKTYIYSAIIPPLSFILLIIMIFLNAPIHSRISNTSLFIAISLFSSVILWGVFLLIRKMSISGIINPDIGFLTPFIILLSFTIYYFRKI